LNGLFSLIHLKYVKLDTFSCKCKNDRISCVNTRRKEEEEETWTSSKHVS
jgi:hypothetical protein